MGDSAMGSGGGITARTWGAGAVAWWVALVAMAASARAEEKFVVAKDAPAGLGRLKVAPDGRKLYIASGQGFAVIDDQGRLVDRVAVPQGSAPRDLIPLPDGWFVMCTTSGSGRLSLARPDGTEARVIVGKGGEEKVLRGDSTGWTSPGGAAVDAGRKRIFALDTTLAPAGTPDPDWSRIAAFDFDGKFLGDIRRYDAKASDRDDGLRTWYEDIAVDPARERLYVLARRSGELLAFGYDGKPAGKAMAPGQPGQLGGGLAVFPDGRVAASRGHKIRVFDPGLRALRDLDVDPLSSGDVLDLEADATGRLYAIVGDPTVTFIRWPADLKAPRAFGPDFLKIEVEFPGGAVTSGTPFVVKVKASGRPAPRGRGAWRAMARPADGTDLVWRAMPVQEREGELLLATPPGLRGLYEVAIRYGDGPIDWANSGNDPSVHRTMSFVPRGASRSVSAFTADGRRAYRQGEAIPVQVVRRGSNPSPRAIRLALKRGEAILGSARAEMGSVLAVEIPGTLTRRLPPGRFLLGPEAEGHEPYDLAFDIAPALSDSPMQRLLYHEFDQVATVSQADLGDYAERLEFLREYARALAGLGFTRETDRFMNRTIKDGPAAWRRGLAPADVAPPGAAPPDYFGIPYGGPSWEVEAYLDQGVRRGIAYDSQLLGHCSGVRFRESWLRELLPVLQRDAQWMRRYPSFYGVNYNDEMFFGGWGSEWSRDDDAWLKRVQDREFPGRPRADVLDHALRVMYGRFNAAVRLADPSAKLTTTPMWQFPAVEGSYAPAIYAGMSESYSHFLSEGYALPWNPAHSAEILRRPGLPLMGVFDNATHPQDGDVYFKNVMQVVARGVQGVGVEHAAPFGLRRAADEYRTANLLARLYGPIFAEAPPANEAAVLYSRTQDISESRNTMGTPHWERVYGVVGAGLMAGVPTGVTYEEDVVAGWLLEGRRPRWPMLLLVGQTKALPAKVREAISAYRAAGGRVFADADSAEFPGATRLAFGTHGLKAALTGGYASDSVFALAQPALEALAADLARALGPHRRFPMDADDPWVSKNGFDGGAIRYLMLATETSPYPWDAGKVWSLGAYYSRSYLPKRVALSFPSGPGVIYDVFDHAILRPQVSGTTARLAADLTTAPGRLFAIAPAPLAAPKVSAGASSDPSDPDLRVRVEIVGDDGRPIAARVPIRVRLMGGGDVAADLVRGTGADGVFSGTLPLPATAEAWTLEVTELLGGKGSTVDVRARAPLPPPIAVRPDVEPLREDRIRALMEEAHGSMTLILARGLSMDRRVIEALTSALGAKGVDLKVATSLPKEPEPGVYLAIGLMQGYLMADQPEDLLWRGWVRGLFPQCLSAGVPGPGRGLFTAIFAPRGDGEHAIALLASDTAGLDKTIAAFIQWLGAATTPSTTAATSKPIDWSAGRPAEVAPVPRLSELVGPRLSGVAVAADGTHLVLTADGYLRNLALVEDQGTQARVVRAVRVGQAPAVEGAYISDDGRYVGTSARTIARFGEGFHLVEARSGAEEVFASFGDMGGHRHQFGASDRGDVVLAPGPNGVVCWRRGDQGWREAWAIDDWKRFDGLDWPVSPTAERSPQFHAVVPRGADYALILDFDSTNNGWVTNECVSTARLRAVALADGKERWRFDVPIPKTLIFPALRTSPDGSRCLLSIQVGTWGKETFRTLVVDQGKALGSWDSRTEPVSLAVADGTGVVAASFKGRLLEVRRPDGLLLLSRLWPDVPVGLAFATDGVGVYVADDAGHLTYLDARGRSRWRAEVGFVSSLAARGDRIYAAGRDGRLRCFDAAGRSLWTLDCTPAMGGASPMREADAAAKSAVAGVHRARRPPTTSPDAPDGPNLLRDGRAVLTVGGTPSWMSGGTVEIKPEALSNGRRDDVDVPWLTLNELYWDSTTGRQVWAEIDFKAPTDVKALTVFENAKFPESWPTDGLVQVWDDPSKSWKSASRGVFLEGPINTYRLDLKNVTKLRYVPWGSYYRNFYTSEIEVR